MKKKIYFKSIRTKMILYFSSLVLLTITIFMFFSINYTKDNLMENSAENSRQLIEQVNLNIENYIDYMENISQVIISSSNVKNYLFHSGNGGLDSKLEEYFQVVLKARKDIYNIALYGDNGRYFINDGKAKRNPYARLEKKEWYQEAKAVGSDIVISSSHVQNMVDGDYKWVVTFSRGVVNPQTMKVEGLLMIDLNYDVINDLCGAISLGKKGYVYILDQKGEIVYHPQQQLILSGVKKEPLEEIINSEKSTSYIDENGEEKIYTPFQSVKTGWTIVGVVYTSELVKNEKTVQYMYIGLGSVLTALAILLAFLMSNGITRPLKQLKAAMKEVQEGKFEPVYAAVKGDNEIASLNRSFNRMTEHIDELMKKNTTEQAEKRKSEMKALQSQINPHFLYNTLDSIIWMIETGDQEEAILMTSALAGFFRQAIGKSDDFVTIWEELEYTKNYLIIQQMRYKDKIDFNIMVNQDIMECMIIKLVLQPLVENALYHGLKYKEEKGTIRITGYQQRGNIVIKVMDDGIGMDQETLKSIFHKKSRVGGRYNGVGMVNIQERMVLYYGEGFGLFVESEVGIGTTVTVTLPYRLSEEINEDK